MGWGRLGEQAAICAATGKSSSLLGKDVPHMACWGGNPHLVAAAAAACLCGQSSCAITCRQEPFHHQLFLPHVHPLKVPAGHSLLCLFSCLLLLSCTCSFLFPFLSLVPLPSPLPACLVPLPCSVYLPVCLTHDVLTPTQPFALPSPNKLLAVTLLCVACLLSLLTLARAYRKVPTSLFLS